MSYKKSWFASNLSQKHSSEGNACVERCSGSRTPAPRHGPRAPFKTSTPEVLGGSRNKRNKASPRGRVRKASSRSPEPNMLTGKGVRKASPRSEFLRQKRALRPAGRQLGGLRPQLGSIAPQGPPAASGGWPLGRASAGAAVPGPSHSGARMPGLPPLGGGPERAAGSGRVL